MPAPRANFQKLPHPANAAATIRSFSARDHRRRRCTDEITSTCVLVIVVVLGLLLGLHANTQLRTAAVTGVTGSHRTDTRTLWKHYLRPCSKGTLPRWSSDRLRRSAPVF